MAGRPVDKIHSLGRQCDQVGDDALFGDYKKYVPGEALVEFDTRAGDADYSAVSVDAAAEYFPATSSLSIWNDQPMRVEIFCLLKRPEPDHIRRSEHSKTPILFILDEFPRLGKIPAIIDALATLRSKKHIRLIIQNLVQLDLIYGKDSRRVISDTCANKAILSATGADTQEYFLKLVSNHE